MSGQSESPPNGDAPERNVGITRSLERLRVLLLGAAAVVFFLVVIWLCFFKSPLEPVTRENFEAAKRRWREAGVTDYDIEVRVTGRQPAVYAVQVRGGKVVKATHNGDPLRDRRTMGTWSVPGMFGTMETDVEAIERFAAGDTSAPQLRLLVYFDPQYGVPRQYHRIELYRWSSNIDVTWEVLKFQVYD